LSNWKSAWGPLAISPVGHVWSLSIEEQFYLVWPLVVLAAGPVRLARISIVIIVAVTVGRILVAVWCDNAPGELVYRLTIFRVDALAYGSLIASTALPLKKATLASASLGCVLAVIACSYSFHYSSPVMYTIGFTGFDLLAFSLVLVAHGTNHPILRHRLLTSWGKYSYAIYIFHVPINFVLGWKVMPHLHSAFQRTLVGLAVGMSLSYLSALVSWKIIEHPLLQLKDRLAPYTKISSISASPSPVPRDAD
jgi:peptidoglycan/LPS O-acetylase OafA/YrhL